MSKSHANNTIGSILHLTTHFLSSVDIFVLGSTFLPTGGAISAKAFYIESHGSIQPHTACWLAVFRTSGVIKKLNIIHRRWNLVTYENAVNKQQTQTQLSGFTRALHE